MKIKDKEFQIFIDKKAIKKRIKEIAHEINLDYKGKNPLFIAILNGSFMFASDLMKQISLDSEISFIKVNSYTATQSTGKIKELLGLQENIFKRDIIILEDIIDSGQTMSHITEALKTLGPASVEIATLLFKPESMETKLKIEYIGFEIPNNFVVGFGLDYDGFGRNLKDIYRLED